VRDCFGIKQDFSVFMQAKDFEGVMAGEGNQNYEVGSKNQQCLQ
jgi:hypothetical protein